jgi:hypothetical protein
VYDPKSQIKEIVMDKKWLIYGAVFLAGVMLAPKVRSLPLLDKLPSA